MGLSVPGCAFCEIAAGTRPAAVVHADESCLAFLDARPLFLGHVLVVPRHHVPALADAAADVTASLFDLVRRVAAAVEHGLGADGSFVAVNNRVSQSVPHLHVHVVPRHKKDGLRGFFWPRVRYADDDEIERYRARIAATLGAP